MSAQCSDCMGIACCKIYNENQEQIVELNDLKVFYFNRKEAFVKLGQWRAQLLKLLALKGSNSLCIKIFKNMA